MFESNVNYDLGKTKPNEKMNLHKFESNVNYDLGKTISGIIDFIIGLRAM